LAAIACILSAAGFVAGGIAILLSQVWGEMLITIVSVFSAIIFILFWDGKQRDLDDKGGVGVLINVFILIAFHGLHWPDF